jgi:hypothetical protein
MKVAFGKIKITPKKVEGVSLAGYGLPYPCDGKLDDIYAQAVLLEDVILNNINKKLLLISLDIVQIPLVLADYIREKIKDEVFSLGPSQILIHATHTHKAPDITGLFYKPGGILAQVKGLMVGHNRNDRYLVWITFQIVKLIKTLVKELRPCRMAWTKKKFNSNLVINRRHPMRELNLKLGVISFKDLETNKLIGIVINYSCHPTTLQRYSTKLSADYPGRVVAKIEELTGNTVNAIYLNGPSGNLNPITTCGTDYEMLEHNRNLIMGQKGTYEDTKRIGYKIGEEALDLANSIQEAEYFEKLEFKAYLRMIWIPMKDYSYISKVLLPNKIVSTVKKYVILPIAMVHDEGKEPNFPGIALKKRGLKINLYTYLQYIKMKLSSDSKNKEVNFIGIPGELFHEIGQYLLKISHAGPDNTFIVQNTDSPGYIFPFEEYKGQGGYEPFASFSPNMAEYVINELKRLFEEIDEKLTFSYS